MERPYFLSPRILSRSFPSRASVSSADELRRPLERRVGLGDEPADRHRAADVVLAGDLAALGDHVHRHVGDLEDVLVRLGRQAAHEVQLHLAPAVAVRGGDGPDQVLLRDHLVDDLAHALGAALGREGQAGAAAVAGQLVRQVDVEGVHAGRGEGQADLVLLVPVREALGDVADLASGRRRTGDSRPTSSKPVAFRPFSTISPMPVMRALAHRAGDHARLAEAAAARAAAEDLHRHALVDRLGERDQGLLGVGPLVQVHDGVLGHPPRHAGPVRYDAARSGRRAGTRRRRTPGCRPRPSSRGGTGPPRGRRAGPPPSRRG